jgi:eukaryotic-like serine/threonine-protein kinase
VSQADQLSLPTTLGRYRLLTELARGGMATVYLARMTGKAGFERNVAVKVLHRHLASDPEFVAMFLDEARIAARVSHSNVVDVYDIDALEGKLIIVMRYVEGASLANITRKLERRCQQVPLGSALRIMHDALRGLHAAHELVDGRSELVGLVHRDVTPHNIMVGTDGVARVTDFGIAKARGRIATTQDRGVVKGKLRYLAPEQIERQVADRRVDVFSAGIVLWECLTGVSLFDADTEGETLARVLSAPIRRPGEMRAEVPPELDAICLEALERDPSRRFASAGAFADALEERLGASFSTLGEVGGLVTELAGSRIERVRLALQSATDSSRPSLELAIATADTGELPVTRASAKAHATESGEGIAVRDAQTQTHGNRRMRLGVVALLVLAALVSLFLSLRGEAASAQAQLSAGMQRMAADILAAVVDRRADPDPPPEPPPPVAPSSSAPAPTPRAPGNKMFIPYEL